MKIIARLHYSDMRVNPIEKDRLKLCIAGQEVVHKLNLRSPSDRARHVHRAGTRPIGRRSHTWAPEASKDDTDSIEQVSLLSLHCPSLKIYHSFDRGRFVL